MPELITITAETAIKSRLTRAKAALERLGQATAPIDLELIAMATTAVSAALQIPAASHPAIHLPALARSIALKNLTTLLGYDLVGLQVPVVADVTQAARNIETAVYRAKLMPPPARLRA